MADELQQDSPTTSEATTDSSKPSTLMLEGPAPTDPNAPIKLDVGTSEPTLSRIGNWHEMDELERARVLRVLGKRNQIRLEERKAALEKEQAEAADKSEA
ncbi:hypothetical protein MNV49_003893 [Pseudohyphozyma bogoriensis]|nr:hypothetical protein MNV49_003893 [Pseudohyphozyma bogoriensis]